MRKLLFVFTMLTFSQFSFGQAVSDNAVIPVSVTLNSILRLTVTSGGNIQFVFTTMDNYSTGIGPGNRWNTMFNVSSSRDYTVVMDTDVDDFFTGLEAGTATEFANGNINYNCTGTGATAAVTALANTQTIVTNTASGAEPYQIAWECGTTTPLLGLSLAADIYVQNIFLTLVAP